MTKHPLFDTLRQKLRRFRHAHAGNVMVMFAFALVPILGGIGSAVDYGRANSIKSAMQGALDSAALATVKIASTLTSDQIQTKAQGYFTASFNRPEASSVQVTSQYDAATTTLTLNASAAVSADFVKVFGVSQLNVSANSKAKIGSKTWQVCVLVTDPDSNHTLLVKDGSKIDFNNCMVQVNTKNWDAVEARDTSYIHSVNGENCFVGDIHYGDVQPPKDPTCTFFDDPFAGYKMPASAGTCSYVDKTVLVPETLKPGTYCGGLNVNADTILNKGLYIIKDGNLQINSKTNVTANGVTFLFTGDKLFDSGSMIIQIQTTGTINLTPANEADAGQFAGFVFYIDQWTAGANKKTGKVRIWNTNMNTSGILYLRGAEMDIGHDAVLTVNPGSIVADFILPDKNGTLNLTGSLNSSLAVLNSMKKTGTASGGPILVQ